MSETPIPEQVLRYLAIRETQRHDDRKEAWATLSEREQGLVKDAMVAGWFVGAHHLSGRKVTDAEIVCHALDVCKAYPDLYPRIAKMFGIEPDDDTEDDQ